MSNPKRSFVSVNIQKIAINVQIINYHEEISKLTENNNYFTMILLDGLKWQEFQMQMAILTTILLGQIIKDEKEAW